VLLASDPDEVVSRLLEVITTTNYVLSVDSGAVAEGDSGITEVFFTLSRDRVDSEAFVTLERTGDASIHDVSFVPTTIGFAAGDVSKRFSVAVEGDTVLETDETFGLRITDVTGEAAFSSAATTFVIEDDDERATQTITVHAAGEAFRGDPTFDLLVNGAVIASDIVVRSARGPLSATELEDAVEAFVFEIDGDIEVETVGVAFTNDRWGGARATDRNLYVSGVEFGGETFSFAEGNFTTPDGSFDAGKQRAVETTGILFWDGVIEFG
jgi:hypothetical protein